MKAEYIMIHLPLPLPFREMSKKQANEFLSWFQEQIPSRHLILTHCIQSSPGYQTWEPDLTLESLDGLGKWFFSHIETRKRSKTEFNSIYQHSPAIFSSIEVPDWELTYQTFSISIDIGMYLSQILQKNILGLKWDLGKGSKKNIDYQQPVLVGTGKLVFNPIHIMTTLAYGIANRTKGPERLKELYEIWASILSDG
jgi:hypothetical protein